ncbi:hypothetical protein VNI00_000542 [Paramarasmius palmivorus]|uniref:Inhibitor of growth protein N-terminal histone-binding domain-containing protein n=1 Tax=Paramarasmius palmivorus TaxID=297713 RepID=A0AAW0E9P1_9AGAR
MKAKRSPACMDDILPTLKRYIALRRDLDAQHKARTVPQQEASAPENPLDITQMAAEGDSEGRTDTPMDVDPQPEELNRTTTEHAVSADGSPLFTPVTSKDPTPPPPTATTVNSSPPPTSATTHATPPPTTATTTTSSIPLPSTPIRAIPHHLSTQNLAATASPRTPTPIGIPQDRNRIPTTSREMLTHIAWASDEMIRASNEKVHIAQTLHDTLERQIRALNQSIKEQELALSLGTRPGTQLAPILLPEIAPVSRWTKPSNPTSDIDSDDDLPNGGLFEPDGEQGDTITTLGVVSDDPGGGRKRGKRAGNNRSEKLKIKLPASAAAANSNEIYCYCRMTSWGEVNSSVFVPCQTRLRSTDSR